MNRYAFVTAGSENYIEGLKAQVNSINAHHTGTDIVLIAWRLPETFIDSLPKNVKVIRHPGSNQIQDTAIYRFKVAHDMGKRYKAICLLDADMFFTADCRLFFDIAAKGFIVAGSNGMVVDFNKLYQEKYGIPIDEGKSLYTKIHTTAPIFISGRDTDWFDALYTAERVDAFDDFLYLNLLGMQMGKDEKMLVMPPYAFTGIHHWQLKPETSLIEKDGKILSGTEEQVYIVHGKWWWEQWMQDQLNIMEKYLKDQEMGNKCLNRVQDAFRLIQREFIRYRDMEIKR